MKIHLGFHFYGAGNIGDELMLAGFLRFLRETGRFPRMTCSTPHDIVSQRHRFPEIEWMAYESELRRSSIRECDVWLGLGDTPFQSDSGMWLLDHIVEEVSMLREYSTAGYMLCVGVNNRAATLMPQAETIMADMRQLWMRDIGSANLLADKFGWHKLRPASDLAHLYFDSPKISRLAGVSEEPLLMVIASEDIAHLSYQALGKVVMDWPGPVYWYCQEVREFACSELYVYARLPDEARAKVKLITPDYHGGCMEELIAAFDGAGACLTSRYHSAVGAAWRGLRTAVFSRNDKLASATAQMGLTPVASLTDAHVMLDALYEAKCAEPTRLLGLRHSAYMACESFFRIIEA